MIHSTPHSIITVADRMRWTRLIARDFTKYMELDPASLEEVIAHHPDRYQRAAGTAAKAFLDYLATGGKEPEGTRFSAPTNKLEDIHG